MANDSDESDMEWLARQFQKTQVHLEKLRAMLDGQLFPQQAEVKPETIH